MKKHQRVAFSIALAVAILVAGCDISLGELTGAISPVPENGVVKGDEFHYYLVFPQGWFERNFNIDPEWDREFILPDKGAPKCCCSPTASRKGPRTASTLS